MRKQERHPPKILLQRLLIVVMVLGHPIGRSLADDPPVVPGVSRASVFPFLMFIVADPDLVAVSESGFCIYREALFISSYPC